MFRLPFRVGVGWVGVGWVYGGWITTAVIIRPSQPSLAGVGAGAELGKNRKLAILDIFVHSAKKNIYI